MAHINVPEGVPGIRSLVMFARNRKVFIRACTGVAAGGFSANPCRQGTDCSVCIPQEQLYVLQEQSCCRC